MEMDTIEEQFTGLTASGVETLQKRWKAHPEQVVGSAVVAMVIVFYLRSVSPIIIGVWCFFFSAFCTVTYLRLRHKAFELTPIVLVKGGPESDSSAVHSAARKLSRRWDICHVCLEQECTCSAVAQASEVVENSVLVSPAVNALLEDIFKLVIEQYVESWYSLYSTDPEGVVEIQIMMKHMGCAMARRVHDIDMAALIRTRLIPAFINHIEAYLVAESRVGSGDESVHRRALALYGAGLHAAFSSEERYFRSIFMESLALPGVLDRGKNKCRSLKLFIAQNMVTSVKSSLQSASQPRVINAAIVSALSSTGEPADATPRARLHSGSTFEPLCNFVPVTAPRKSSLNLDAHAVLSDVDLRMHYQVFATRTNNIDMVMLYRKLEDMMGTLHSAIAAEDVPTFHKYAVAVTTQVAVLPVSQIVSRPYCSAIRRIAERSVGTLKPEQCSKAPFEEMWKDVQEHVRQNLIPAFLRSREYFEAMMNRPEPTIGRPRASANTEKNTEKPKATKKAEKRREAEIQAEIELLNLPPPPSAVEEEHPDLVTDETVKKKKKFFARKKTADRPPPPQRGRSSTLSETTVAMRDSASKIASTPSSPAGSPTLPRRRSNKSDSPAKAKSGRTTPAASPVPVRKRPQSLNLEDTVIDADVLTELAAHPRRPIDDSPDQPQPDAEARVSSGGSNAAAASADSDPESAVVHGQAMKVVEPEVRKYDLTGVSTVIKNWEKRHPGSRQFVVYTILVSQRAENGPQSSSAAGGTVLSTGNTWEVDRRYSDFATLEKKLKRLYPEFDLATLPDKKRFGNLETKHLDMRKTFLHTYLSSLVENPLIHNDRRCEEIVHKFLDRKCDFKEEMKSHAFRRGSGRPIGKITSLLSKKDKNWSSFTSLFTVTEDDVEEAMAAAYDVEVQTWTQLQPSLDAARAAPDAPVVDVDALKATTSDEPDCFSATVELEDCSVATRLVRLLGTMCGRLRHAWLPQSILGLGKLLLGGSIDINLKLVCEAAIKLDESTLLSALKAAKASLEQAGATDSTDGDAATSPPKAGPTLPTDQEIAAQLRQAIDEVIPEAVSRVFGETEVERLTSSLVNVFQDDVYNKQLAYTVTDAVISAIFPELKWVDPPEEESK
eukprot:m.257539 g.257539  ORF g.257539 m.257539 type:complete len:1118 (+) comp26595_c0_seq1:557-3910(+)